MPPQETKHVPVGLYVALVLTVAVLACVSTVFSGAGSSFIQRLFNITPESTSEPIGTPESGSSQDAVSALETQIALQETVIAQQEELLDEAHTPVSPLDQETTSPDNSSSQPPSTSDDCSQMIPGEHNPPTLGVDWKFDAINEDRIIHIWSNHWDPNLPEYKFFLPAGQTVSFKSGGGSFWTDRGGCNGVAETLFERDTFQEITLEEYQSYIENKTIP